MLSPASLAAPDLGPLLSGALLHAGASLNLLFVSAAWSIARPSYPVTLLLIGASVGWLFLNQPLEGRVLVSLNTDHGFTEADILSCLGLALAARTFAKTRELGVSAEYQSDSESK